MYYYNLAESGKRLKDLRNKKGRAFTQERVAEEVGISREHLNRLEIGKRGCSVDLLLIFAQYYDVTMDYITYGKGVYGRCRSICYALWHTNSRRKK